MIDIQFSFDSLTILGSNKQDDNLFVLVQGCYVDCDDDGEDIIKTCAFEIRDYILEEAFHKWLIRKWELSEAYKTGYSDGNMSVFGDESGDTFILDGEEIKIFHAWQIGGIHLEVE